LSEPLAATTAALEIQRHTGTARDFTAKRGARHELARAGPRYSAIRIGNLAPSTDMSTDPTPSPRHELERTGTRIDGVIGVSRWIVQARGHEAGRAETSRLGCFINLHTVEVVGSSPTAPTKNKLGRRSSTVGASKTNRNQTRRAERRVRTGVVGGRGADGLRSKWMQAATAGGQGHSRPWWRPSALRARSEKGATRTPERPYGHVRLIRTNDHSDTH
jgi:hypothetical protein